MRLTCHVYDQSVIQSPCVCPRNNHDLNEWSENGALGGCACVHSGIFLKPNSQIGLIGCSSSPTPPPFPAIYVWYRQTYTDACSFMMVQRCRSTSEQSCRALTRGQCAMQLLNNHGPLNARPAERIFGTAAINGDHPKLTVEKHGQSETNVGKSGRS